MGDHRLRAESTSMNGVTTYCRTKPCRRAGLESYTTLIKGLVSVLAWNWNAPSRCRKYLMLDGFLEERRAPEFIRSDYRSEFIAQVVKVLFPEKSMKTLYIDPCWPWEPPPTMEASTASFATSSSAWRLSAANWRQTGLVLILPTNATPTALTNP